MLTFLASRSTASGTPVPVIFALGSWDPNASIFGRWQERQLVTSYPFLAERDGTGTTLAAQLLATGRILPVLDGFDEISAGLRTDAISGINSGLRPGGRLLLTSRPEEYAAAVCAGDVLTAAAVVQLKDLAVSDIGRYLSLATRKPVAPARPNKWDPVLDHLRAARSPTALTEVLSTPLMISLARAIYSDSDRDPVELLTIPSVDILEDRLLAGFVPAVYSRARDGDHPFAADIATPWLGFLAAHMRRLGTYDFAWWQLEFAVPRRVMGLIAGSAYAVSTWLGAGLPLLLGALPPDIRAGWLVACLVGGLIAGAAGGFAVGQLRSKRPSPARTHLKLHARLGRVGRDLGREVRNKRTLAWIIVWLIAGLLAGTVATITRGSADGIVFGVGAGLVFGVGTWFAAAAVRAIGTPVDPTETISPAEVLRTDRTTAIREGLANGMIVSTVAWLTIWLGVQEAFGVSLALAYGNGVWLLTWLVMVTGGAMVWTLDGPVWGRWLIARTWLSLTGRLPWALMTFLADAHRRGVLRQAGGIYQFRHAHLQNHLATSGGRKGSANDR